ncbi:hypothetical protein FSP39_001856 [Pinctada imbricata]|uniref:Protein ECT2 n=1 Tax=Pinctada imbricata TaxID=66713 RepID=A0AA88XYU1_PINIB|nr:hypothetical protein FSP39_001856 [Pinctada imbricata]
MSDRLTRAVEARHVLRLLEVEAYRKIHRMLHQYKNETQVILVGEETQENDELKAAIEKLNLVAHCSATGLDYVHKASELETIFVLSKFEGDVFHKLHKAEVRIVGPPLVMHCANRNEKIPVHGRPLYCTAMKGVIACLTGFSRTCRKEDLNHMVDLIHHMGGSLRKDISAKVTHLVSNCTDGEKYRFAVSFGTPIMSSEWIYKTWAERDAAEIVKATDEQMMQHRVPPFYKCCLCFYGFSEEEKKHMEELTIENGGIFASLGDEDVTHLVVDEQQINDLPTDIVLPHYVIRGEWFWGSIQMEACADETLYEYRKNGISVPGVLFTPDSTMCGSKSRKRKRLKENIAQLMSEGELDSPMFKRRSSDGRLSMSPNSFLDASNTPDKSDILADCSDNRDKSRVISTKISPRSQVVMELLQTEKNYVAILHTILNVFKSEIEKPNQYNGPILAAQDTKLIFGNIPPIYKVHCAIKDKLIDIIDNWRDDCSVGDIFITHADELNKAYPPFVNFFDQTKETIAKCDKTNSRFHAFLKVCQSKPECGRQSLTELLIRPVQRLPSVSLLLNDILKKTSKDNPDYGKLEKAINVLKEVMTYINEDRRKTEQQVVMFDVINEIDNCPVTLLSSHRSFIIKIDVIQLSDDPPGRGTPLALFLFSDTLEVCKRRTKYMNSVKSPALHKTPQKPYKHLYMLQLATIKRVLNCMESEDCKNSFGFIRRNQTDSEGKLFSFMVDSDDTPRKEFITSLAKKIAHTICLADHESLVASIEGKDLQISTNDLGRGTLSRAAKIGKRVSRAFSFNKTPNRLKRAVSTVSHAFSPNSKSQNTLLGSPNGRMLDRRLGSCVDLTDYISMSSYSSTTTLYEQSDTVSLAAFPVAEDMD